jgi:hypothetical protein
VSKQEILAALSDIEVSQASRAEQKTEEPNTGQKGKVPDSDKEAQSYLVQPDTKKTGDVVLEIKTP